MNILQSCSTWANNLVKFNYDKSTLLAKDTRFLPEAEIYSIGERAVWRSYINSADIENQI